MTTSHPEIAPAPSPGGRQGGASVAVLMSGSSGLVAPLARSLRDDGVRIAVITRPGEDAGPEEEGDVHIQSDATTDEEWSDVTAHVERRLGTPTLMVNDLVEGPVALSTDLSSLRFRAHLDAEVGQFFARCRAILPAMALGGGGSVVTVTSVDVDHAYPARAAQAASRAAISGLTRALAVEWAAAGIRLNSLCLGPLAMVRDADERHIARTPMGRNPTEAELVAAARLLLDGGPAFITGTSVHIDGGWSKVNSAAPGLRFP